MFQQNKEEKAIQKLQSIDFGAIYDDNNDGFIYNDINGSKRFTITEKFNTYFYEIKDNGNMSLVINGKSTLDITSEQSKAIKESLIDIGKMNFSKNMANNSKDLSNLESKGIEGLAIKKDRFDNITVNSVLCKNKKEVGLNIFQTLKKVSLEKFDSIKDRLLSKKKSNKNKY
jgi:hypothetical protein